MKKKRLLPYLSMIIGTLSFSMLVSTLSLYKTLEEQKIKVDVSGNLTNLFILDNDGNVDDAATIGDGTSENPYMIDNEYELKMFAKIVNMGLSSSSDYYKLGSDISLISQMAPIGNEHTPFYSTFDGAGHTITFTDEGEIFGLDTSDVGFFGFVSSGATIKNFILDAPKVTVAKSDSMTYSIGKYTSDLLDLNPLRNSSLDNVEIVLEPDTIEDETTLKNGYGAGSSFSMTISNWPNEYVCNVVSNKTGILSIEKTSESVGETTSSFVYTLKVADDLSSFTESNYYFTIEISTSGVVNITNDSSNPDYRLTNYMVERIKFCLENQVIVIKSDYSKTYKRILNPGTLKSGSNSNGDIYTNNNHVTYAGLVVGHLEGVADYIGVKNESKISANGKPFRSNSLLVGRRIEDDNNSSLSREYFTPNEYSKSGFSYVLLTTSNYYSSTDAGFTNSGYPNYITKDIYKTQGGSINDNKEEQIKLFGSSTGNDHGINLSTAEYSINSMEENEDPSTVQKILSFTDGFSSSIGGTRGNSNWYINNGYTSCSLSNAIGVWCSTADTSGGGFFNSLLSSQNFYATIEFDYCLFTDKDDYDNDLLLGLWAFGKRAKQSQIIIIYYNFFQFQSDSDGNNQYAANSIINGRNNYSDLYGSIVDENDVEYTDDTIINSEVYFKNDEITDSIDNISSDKKYDVKHKKIRFKADLLGLNSGIFSGDNKYSPYICIGIDDDDMGDSSYRLDITDLTITFSDSKGNYEAGPLTVDYLTSNTTATYNEESGWSNWDPYSSTRVGVQMISTSTEEVSSDNGGENGSNLPYIETIPNNYYVTANRTVKNTSYSSSKFVEITYHDDSNTFTGSGVYLIPVSIEGFTEPISITQV
ncbi:MAG: hypothetical protein ACI31G_00020 [Bacilli bacterium]